METLASLEPQDVREYWSREDLDFTPWLADEISAEQPSKLEDALGLDLEVEQIEKRVGKYNVDIFAKVVGDGRNVIIENQLEDSDHDHLGKAIAYAAGLDADIIVWIAPEFNDEHLDAVLWLNENSREGIDLFAIRLEVWKIEDSPAADRFNPIQKPSEWKEKAQRSGNELNEQEQIREEFWTEFRDRIQSRTTPLRARKPWPRHYYSNPIGPAGYHMSFGFYSRDGQIRLDLIIEDNEDAFWELKTQEDELEAELGMELHWDEPRETRGGNMRSNVKVVREGDVYERDSWEDYFEWMFEAGEKFHEVFDRRLQNIG